VLTIDRLALRLPPGLEGRARRIVELVAAELARADLGGAADVRVARLAPPPVTIAPGASDARIAGQIAAAVSEALGRSLRGGAP
jgi:hypothetical protein